METFLDISDFDNQVFIALQMSEIFSAQELEQLQFNSIIIPPRRDINDQFEIFFDKIFQSNNRFQLVDMITHVNNRPERCIDIRIHKTNKIEIIIKCDFDMNVPTFTSDIVCLAINYIKYGIKSSRTYNMNKLAENFVKIAYEISSQKNSIENCKSMIAYLLKAQNDDHDEIYHNQHYLKQFDKGNCSYTLMIHSPQMLKFILYNKDWKETEYIFIPKSKIGIIILLDICNKILNYKQNKENK
jgi:hypothetical protein